MNFDGTMEHAPEAWDLCSLVVSPLFTSPPPPGVLCLPLTWPHQCGIAGKGGILSLPTAGKVEVGCLPLGVSGGECQQLSAGAGNSVTRSLGDLVR